MPRERWQVPPMWSGETVAIIAGGPSAVDADLESLRGRCRVITINNSHLLTPWADILWFCDSRWYTWHKDAVDKFDGLVVTLENYDLATDQDNFRSVHNYGQSGLCEHSDGVMTGRNSGYQCINLAVHLGASRILLIGYDMRTVDGESHWHGGHRGAKQSDSVYQRAMLPMFDTIAQSLLDRGVEVYNCTPGSALKVFPFADVETCLQHDPQSVRRQSA